MQITKPIAMIISAALISTGLLGAGLLIRDPVDEKVWSENHVYVQQTEYRDARADIADFNFSYEAQGPDPQTVMAKIASDRQTVIEFLKANGIAESEFKFEVTVNSQDAPEVTELQAQEVVTITSANIDAVTAMTRNMLALSKAGVKLTMASENLNYRLLHYNHIKAEIVAAAIKNSRQQADMIAEATGKTVVGIYSVTPSDFRVGDKNDPDSSYARSIDKTISCDISVEYLVR